MPAGRSVAAADPLELSWEDLVPDDGGVDFGALRRLGVIQHGQLSTPFDQETGSKVTNAYDGRMVRIPGYLLPLDFENVAITSALLVPFVGACVHVPPPPPNQLIFLEITDPYESDGLFEPVWATGVFSSSAAETMFAEVGYSMVTERLEPYG